MLNPNISAPAALIGEPTRAAILMSLCDGRAHAAGAIAAALSISPQSASNHLALLVEGGLLTVVQQGRHRYFRIAGESVAQSIEALAGIASPIRLELLRNSRAHEQLSVARCCYSHLAGALGVSLLEALLRRKTLICAGTTPTGRTLYRLSDDGATWASSIGLHLAGCAGEANPKYAVSCIDWTERKSHLAGLLGAQFLDHLVACGFLKAAENGRSLKITPEGASWLWREFEIDVHGRALRTA